MQRFGVFLSSLLGKGELVDEIAQIVIIGIFVLFSLIGNALKKKAEKKELDTREDRIQPAKETNRKKTSVQRKQTEPYRRLPYAKISQKPAVEPGHPQKSAYLTIERPLEQPLPVEAPSISPKSPTIKEAEKPSIGAGIEVEFVRQMLKNPKDVRHLVAASEILANPLALRE